jgi:hypothetical protein
MSGLRVARQRGPEYYGCPEWCEVADHEDCDGADGPWYHSAPRCVPYRAADVFILGGEKCQNPLGVSLERTGDGPPRVVLCNEDEPVPVLLELTVAEAAALAAVLHELTALGTP